MEVFYIAVLAIATGILILILTSVGVLIRKSNTDAPWTPTAGRCPDFWTEVSGQENKGKCYHEGVNKGLISTTATVSGSNLNAAANSTFSSDIKNGDTILINNDINKQFTVYSINATKTQITVTSGTDLTAGSVSKLYNFANTHPTTCNKRSWAITNGVQWDGVTNYNKCA